MQSVRSIYQVISVSYILYNLFPFFDWLLSVALYVMRRCSLNLVHGVSLLRSKVSRKPKEERHDGPTWYTTNNISNQSINQSTNQAINQVFSPYAATYHNIMKSYLTVINNTLRHNLKIQLSIQHLVLIYSPSKPIEKPPSNANIAQANANQHSEIGSKYY